jgi:hypothetical protein
MQGERQTKAKELKNTEERKRKKESVTLGISYLNQTIKSKSLT